MKFAPLGKGERCRRAAAVTIKTMASRITPRDVYGMVDHWIKTPVNGYLGSRYGSDLKSLLQTPQAAGIADGLIAKCRQDVPILTTAGPEAVSVWGESVGSDELRIVFRVLDQDIEVGAGDSFAPDRGGDAIYSTEPELLDTISQAGAALLHQQVHAVLPDNDYF